MARALDTWKKMVMSKSVLIAVSLGILINAIFILLFIVAGLDILQGPGVSPIFVVILLLACGLAGVYFAFCIKRNRNVQAAADGPVKVHVENKPVPSTKPTENERPIDAGSMRDDQSMKLSHSELNVTSGQLVLSQHPDHEITPLSLSELVYEPLSLSEVAHEQMKLARGHGKDFWRQPVSHDSNDWVQLEDELKDGSPMPLPRITRLNEETATEQPNNQDKIHPEEKRFEDSAVQTRHLVHSSNGLEKSPTCTF